MEFEHILYALVLVVGGVLIAAALIWFGYWMGRNSAEKPLRSLGNPPMRPKKIKPAIPEPHGDLFQDAAFGYPGEDGPGIPTIGAK